MDEPSEITILEEGSIKISNKRAILLNKTYAMANITSVSMTYIHGFYSCFQPVKQGCYDLLQPFKNI